ncbi:MAG: hypothetical protein ABWY93_22635 [Mycobacterium sp.]
MKIDFSRFHPLDHRPFTARCRSLYGGTRNHLRLTWAYRRRDQVLGPWRRIFGCAFGSHREIVVHLPAGRIRPCCQDCGTVTRLPSEADIDEARNLPGQ